MLIKVSLESSFLGDQIIGYVVQASLEDLRYLSANELNTWNTEKQYRRFRMDWLSGRIAAKLVARDLLAQYDSKTRSLETIIIGNDEEGRPYTSFIESEPFLISISHSNSTGLALGSTLSRGLGCDIELIKDRSPDFRQRFLSNYEQDLWNSLYENEKYSRDIINTAAWSSKEASIKCLKSTKRINDLLVLDLQVEPCENGNPAYNFLYAGNQGRGIWRVYEDYIMSVAVLY